MAKTEDADPAREEEERTIWVEYKDPEGNVMLIPKGAVHASELLKEDNVEKKYTGGKVGDKYYGGGPVYPRPTKGS
jgi:hypothetical protein